MNFILRYATEAVSKVISYGFNGMGLTRNGEVVLLKIKPL